MPSQFSSASRLHPAYETARMRDHVRAKQEINRYLDEAARMRARIAAARVLPSVEQQA